MYDPKLTKPPQDFSKGVPKTPAMPKPADDQEIDLDTWDDMVADKFKVPKSLMKAVRGQESGGDINAKSPTGVRGRYQVTKATAQSYGLDRDDPWQQSVAAAKHLRKLFDETDGADDDEKWLGAVGKYYGGNNAVRNGELVGSSIDGVSNPAEHVRRVAQKWGEIRRSERGTQPQAQPQQPAPRGTSSADIIPPEQRLTIPEGQSLNIGTGQIGKRAPVQGAAARRPNEAVEGAQRALSPLIPDEIEQEARQIANRATISDETRGYRRTPPPMVPSASVLNRHTPFNAGVPKPQPSPRVRVNFNPKGPVNPPAISEETAQRLNLTRFDPDKYAAALNERDRIFAERRKQKIEDEASRSSKNVLGKAGTHFTRGVIEGATAPIRMAAALDPRPGLQQTMQGIQGNIEDWQSQNLPIDQRQQSTINPLTGKFYTGENLERLATETLPRTIGAAIPYALAGRGAGLIARGSGAIGSAAADAALMSRAAVGGLGAMQGAESEYQRARSAGMSDEQARKSAVIGALIGGAEGLGSSGTAGAVVPRGLGGLKREIRQEFGQEMLSNLAGDINAKYYAGYEPNKPLRDIAGEAIGSGALGGIVGGLMAAPGAIESRPPQGKILREGGQPVSRDAAAQEPFAPTVRQPSPQETADADIRGVVQNYVAEMSALEKQPRTPERDAQMAQMREDYRALRKYIRDPQSLSDEQLQAILGRQQAAPEVAAEPMAQETVAPGVENAPTAEVAPVEPSAPRPSGYVDVARTAQAEAADAERAGNWEAAVTRYAEQHEALKQYQRELRKTGTPEQKAEIARQISAADLSRRRAGREVLRQERIANAPTKGLPRERASTPKAAEVAPTGELLSSTVNPEGGVPKLPTQEVDFTRLAAEQSAQKPPKPAKRLLSRIAELGGIDERYAGELQDAADARRIGVIRKRAQMSPDIMARQLASEGYDVDPEDLNTLWEAARRDIVQGERPVNTAELTRRGEGTAELEQRLVKDEAAYNERPPFDQIVADVDTEPTNRLRDAEYEGGEVQRYSKPLEGQPVERESFAPVNEKDYILQSAYDKRQRDTYFGEGRELRSTENPQTAPVPPLGSWMIDDGFKALDGREISQLVSVPVDNIEVSEDSGPQKWESAKRYAKWIKEGKEAPPIRLTQTSKGTLKTLDHRRLLAAKAAGQKEIKAWVSWATTSDREGQPVVGLTYELAQKGHRPLPIAKAREDWKIFPDDAKALEQIRADLVDSLPAFRPDTADLRQVREFGRESVEPAFTQEPPTAPLARGRQRITPFRPPSPQQPAGAFPARPSPSPMSRPITPEGRRVQGEIEAGRGKEGEFGKLAQLLFKSTRGDIAHGQDSFFHDKDVKGAVGLTVDAEQGDTRKAIKASVAKMLGVKADEISLTQIKPETWQRWARVKRLGPEANAKLNIAIEKWKQGATNDQETATPQTTERQQSSRASELPATPREAARQQAPATQESAAIKSGDRVQWEQRGRTETAFISRIKGDTAYVDYGTGDEVAVPVKRLRKADMSPADAVRQIKPNGGLVPMVQLKRALGADADAAILAAAERGEIALHRHNQPSAMTAEEKANAVHDAAQGDRGWYIGASVREGATFRQQGPPLKAQMRTRADVESSPAFRQWFGESKVVGEDGKPMVVYHGTFGDFDTFEQTKDIGYHFGTAKAARDRLRGLGKKMASGTRPASGAASTGAYYLSIQNPLEIRDTTGDSWQFLFADLKEKGVLNDEDWRYYNGIANKAMDQALIETEGQSDDAQAEAIQRAAVESSQEIYEDMRQMVLDAGYDGFKYTNRIEGKGSTSWIALKPEQIKSATGNRGTFSAESPSILQQKMPGFYSQLARVIDAKMPAKASAAQVRAIIENPQSGVKPDEIKWTGLDDYLRGKETVTKADVQEFLRANQVEVTEVEKGGGSALDKQLREKYGIPEGESIQLNRSRLSREDEIEWLGQARESSRDRTKYGDYTLPGAKESSYRELLLTMPIQTNKELSFTDYYQQKLRVLYGKDLEALSPADRASARRIYEQTKPAEQSFRRSDGVYKSSHFDEPNILAHIRFNERTDADGKRVLHIEEIQSDWHQEGRKKGYAPTSRPWEVFNSATGEPLGQFETESEARSAGAKSNLPSWDYRDLRHGRVLDAPFKKTWHELAFKRALRWAAENGYERMTWTTGEQQAERFDLSKQVDSITYDGEGILRAWKGNKSVLEEKVSEGRLDDYIGKEAAQKLVNQPRDDGDTRVLQGDNLKVGGEGMKGFYDSILPAFANKYAKKWGAKVGEAKVEAPRGDWTLKRPSGTATGLTQAEAERMARDGGGVAAPAFHSLTVHSMDITPAMRESVMQGQVLFQRNDRDTPFKAKSYEQTIRDAKVAFKTGKRGAAGTVWANEDGLVIIRAAIETAFPADEGEVQLDLQNFFNSNTDSANAQKIANVIKAEAADVDNSPDERRAYRQIARELQAAINSGDTVSIVYSGTFPHAPFNRARARRHELFHAAQQDLRNSPAFFNRNPLARKAGDALAAMNYPRSDWAIEAAAYVASGDHSRMGLTEDEGKQFLTDYFDDIVANNGRDALERFVLMAPKMAATLREAKGRYGIQDQRQAGTDAAQAGASLSGAGNGAAFRASKSSGELPRATPERRRPQTGLLRGIDLEKVKQRQAGSGGTMPPRPPRPPREGDGRREEQSGEPPKQSKLRRAWDQAGNALSLPRALMASLDLSAPLRQGAILTLPPSQWGRAMKATAQMIKSLNTKQFERFVGRLQSHPDRPLADEAGLHLSNKEEDFSSEWTQKIPLVKQSEQAYTSYLDSLRLDTFSRYNKAIEKAGLSADDAKAARKAAAEWINVATGRGSLGESFERAMPVLSKLLFSPRYTASRFQVLNPYTYAKNLRTPGGRIVARNQMADLVQFLGVTGATLALASMAGAEVDDDLQSSDFGKIRVGNTRYDIFAGLLQPLRMMYRVGRDLSGAAVGKESAKGENAMEIAGKFARSKLAPVPSYFVDAVTRKDFIGRDFDPKRGAVERVLPLMWRDFYEAVQREGSLGAAKMTPGFFGIGVQDYEKRPGALGLTGRSRFVQEMRNAGLDYKFAPPLKDEPASLHRARAEKIEQWLSTYGEKLVSHPRWGQLSAEEKKTAISNLRRRVSENANLKQPSTADFDAGRIIAGVRRAATEKPKSDRKKIYAEP